MQQEHHVVQVYDVTKHLLGKTAGSLALKVNT